MTDKPKVTYSAKAEAKLSAYPDMPIDLPPIVDNVALAEWMFQFFAANPEATVTEAAAEFKRQSEDA